MRLVYRRSREEGETELTNVGERERWIEKREKKATENVQLSSHEMG